MVVASCKTLVLGNRPLHRWERAMMMMMMTIDLQGIREWGDRLAM